MSPRSIRFEIWTFSPSLNVIVNKTCMKWTWPMNKFSLTEEAQCFQWSPLVEMILLLIGCNYLEPQWFVLKSDVTLSDIVFSSIWFSKGPHFLAHPSYFIENIGSCMTKSQVSSDKTQKVFKHVQKQNFFLPASKIIPLIGYEYLLLRLQKFLLGGSSWSCRWRTG